MNEIEFVNGRYIQNVHNIQHSCGGVEMIT